MVGRDVLRMAILAAGAMGAAAAGLVLAPPGAQAQFICGGSTTGAEPQTGGGAVAAGSAFNVACGTNASASGANSENTAIGTLAGATGVNSSNTAIGSNAIAIGSNSNNTATGAEAVANGVGSSNSATGFAANSNGDGSFNTAAGSGANASGALSSNTATGSLADARGANSFNIASGAGANASGDGSRNTATGTLADARGANSFNVAIGSEANASGAGTRNTAIGSNSNATGANATAVGAGAQATFANSAAFGNGAVAARANQQTFGTASNTYTMAGIASAASQAAQTGSVQIVTSDASGNLATSSLAGLGLASSADIAGINARLDQLNGQSNRALTGVAMAFAMAGVPTLMPNESFAATVNWGTFEGRNGLALNAAMRLHSNVQLNAGIGYGSNERIAGGRAGLRFGW